MKRGTLEQRATRPLTKLAMFAAIAALCVTTGAFADGLPDGYTQLPYLKANKNVQLKTGYTPSPTDKIVMTWCPTQVTATEALWCARSAVGTAAFTAFQYNSSKVGVLYNTGSTDTDTSTATVTVHKRQTVAAYTKYTIIADGNAGTVAVTNAFTGAEVANCSFTISTNFTVGSQLCLFASHNKSDLTGTGNWSSHFLYSFKVYDAAGTLKLDLVPAKNSSGTVGLYDTVGGSFKTKSTSTGSLTDTLIDKTFDDFVLIDDEVFGKVTVNSGKTLNLNGHNLTASDIAGAGTITDTMVDLTEPDSNGNHVWCTNEFLNTTVKAANLFNNNFSRNGTDNARRIIMEKSKIPLEVDYDFWSPRVVNSYKLYCGPGAGNRNPSAWALYGSNDKLTWTQLHSRSGENLSGDSKAVQTRSYTIDNTTAYRYYRFRGTACRDSGYFEMVQLEYFYSHAGELHLNVPSGKTVNNSTVSLTGKFKLVKEGAGAYIAAKASQTYSGGTELRGGSIDASSADLANPFGSVATVDVYSPLDVHALNFSKFVMKDGSTLDLTGCDAAFDSAGMTFASGANVTVDVTGRTIETGTRIVEWGAKPQNVTFAFVPSGTEPVVGDTGLFYGLVGNDAEFAWWTGAGNDGDPTNPANWACTNAAGNVIADGLPSSPTTVFFAGDVSVQTPSGYNLAPYRCVVKDCILTADSDLRGFGTVEIASGCTLNLNGHKLHVSDVSGTGTIAGNDMAPDHSLDLTVSDSSRVTCTNTFLNTTATAPNLFNNNYARASTDNTKRIILSVDNLPLVVDYDMLTPQLVNMYRMYCGPMDGVQTRCPKDWEFYGSNDEENWVLLDSRSGVTWPTEQTTRSYCFYNTTPYRYYRFKGIASSESSYFEMVQLEYFYQSVAGELHLHVPAGVTNTNSTVLFDGNLKLVKEGDGTFIAAKTDQQYLGGTDILGGTVKLASGAQAQLLGAANSQVCVTAGATLDVFDCRMVYYYKVVSGGGTLTNSGSGLSSGLAQLGSLTLTADSVLDSTHSLGFVNASYTPTLLDLGGHTLDVNTGSGGVFRMSNCDATNGTVRVVTPGGGIISFINGDVRAATVDFDLSCKVCPYSCATVRNLLLRAPCATQPDTLTISVFGRFKTETLDFPDVRLEDGSTFDLSGQQGTFNTAASSNLHSVQYYLTFAPDATVAVDVGARSVAIGDCLVSWPAGFAPAASVKFVLCANGEPVEGKVLAVVESDDRHGIYVKESGTPDYAMWDNGWKFYTQDGEEVAGWTDGVTTNMQVRFSTAAEYTAFCNAGAVTPSAFVLTVDSLAIPAGTTVDLDRTGTIAINEGTVFDVNGGHLKLPASLAEGVKSFTVTNSAVQVGTLEIAVAEGEACVNTAMALTGNLKFLKTGAGTFTAARAEQTYSGGTAVEGGVLASGLPGSSHPFGSDFGTGGSNLLLNGSFDEGEVTANSGSWGSIVSNGATNPNWSFVSISGGLGLTVAGNTWLGSGNPNIGKYALYIQKNGKVYQDVNISASGYYDWSFNCAKRTKYTGNAMEVYLIKLDGGGNETVTNRIASTTPTNDNFWRYVGSVKIDEPGTYRFMIYQPTASADVSNCYDDFVLRPTADTGRITVAAGATFDFNGMRDLFNYQLALDGGTARNTGADLANNISQIGSVIVTADGSRFEAQSNIGLINYGYRQGQLDLRGHTLTVNTTSDKYFWLYNTVVNDGTLDVTGTGTLDIDKTAILATNVSFRIGCYMNVKVPVLVRDYIALHAGNNGTGTAALNVYGTFKPSAHNYFYGPTMQDGSTIDLSARTSSLPLVSDSWDGDRTLKFASGATVTIDVGDRAATLTRGTRLMSWSAIPAGVTFTFGPEATQAGIEPFLTATGLFYGEASNVAEFAWWTGDGNDGNPTNPDNWRCVNASGDEIADGLPSSSTIVYLGGDTASEITLQPSSGYDVVPSKCVVSNCTLAADCDWRVFGTLEIASGCTVYLNGHKLYATGVAGIGTIAGSSDLTEPDVNGNHVSCNNTLYSTSVAANLFNNNYVRAGTDNTKRLIIDNANLPLVVDYDFGVGTVVNCYNIYTGPDDGGRRPKSWEFYGSNDKENWTLLDSHIGVIWPTNPQMTRAFAFENATPYRYYRFKGIESQDAGYFEMVQLEYFGPVQDELHLDIPAGATLINDSVLLTGHMKFVKEGEGTYIGRFQSQSYSGGTLVAAGKAQPGVGAATSSDTGYLYRKPFGFGSVTVAQGATFDVRSNYDYVMQDFIVDGGTFQSTGADMTKTGWSGAAIRKLTADSNLGVTNSLIFGTGTMDLGGNTLSVDITPAKTLYLRGTAITNGTIDITRGGTLNVIGAATDARTVDFRVNCALNVGVALSVHDYEAAYSYNDNGGTAALNVYGAFKPTVACFYGPTMQDGSTLDISAWPGGWPVASGFTSGNTAINFAEGATVKVKIGAKRVGSAKGTKILGWTTEPANVTFVPAEGELFGLRKKDDGLYIYRGMVIIVK